MMESLTLEMVIKILLSTALGLAVGAEREHRHKSAGLRTYTLVAIGSVLFTILSIQAIQPGTPYDPGRIAGQIVVGIGFLGAGLIIHKETRVEGLTTAAGLWTTAAISMAVGFGYYALAVFVTVLTLSVLGVVGFLKEKSHSQSDFDNEQDLL